MKKLHQANIPFVHNFPHIKDWLTALDNDCERNAAERLLCHVRREHPHLEILVTEDGLASNGPHIKTLQQLRLSFILGAKPGDHVTLYARLHQAARDSALKQLTYLEDGFQYQYLWMNSLPLNATHPECVVNFLELTVTDLKQDKSTVFSWVTDLDLHEDSVVRVAQGGRARWKIENETFNTLKNQGYNFEHNFGHGKKNLSVNLMLLMFLAFLIDQVLQLVCPFFRAALAASVRKAALWRKMRNYFEYFLFKDWEHFYHALIFKIKRQHAIIDTS